MGENDGGRALDETMHSGILSLQGGEAYLCCIWALIEYVRETREHGQDGQLKHHADGVRLALSRSTHP